jgi:hypothetical protein
MVLGSVSNNVFKLHQTSIYNKEDVKHDLLPSTASYAPACGVNFGKEKNIVFLLPRL